MLPIAVVIPHQRSRAAFFLSKCLPSVLGNKPAEILIQQEEGGSAEKRNAGAARATQPYLFFVDDDSILFPFCLERLFFALEANKSASFAYSDTKMILYEGVDNPYGEGIRKSEPWNLETLRKGNYVETMSLLRTSAFPGFDPDIKRFQDWDLFLTMGKQGHHGIYVPEVLFELHHIDKGISATYPFQESVDAIKRKHELFL